MSKPASAPSNTRTGAASAGQTAKGSTGVSVTSRHYTIGELAKMFEVTPRTIRFYEQEGLLAPRREGQKRIYREKDRVRLKLTLRGKRLGFSLAEIREVVMMYDAMPDGNARQLKRLLEIIAEKRAELDRQLEDIRLMRLEMDDVDRRAREALDQLDE
ncbi:MerR family transcriptional regulator [Halomonas denitrificans]|uniref:MerR family transcriptional regulator n=1 Tax=Halomonas denitrificans TaxID=370769 RepID=UPI001C992CC1|nr:MerR family DNA-binding transcriptional regulator [Halomonas denitrificans]MBY5970495.1 MerR family DNA-binding transcriptional regulator [Halomonas denitrificans]